MPAPHPHNEAARLNWLRESRILDTPAEPIFDEITQFAAQLCSVPLAAISLVDADRQWFKSIYGHDSREMSRDKAFCAYTILQPDPLIVRDALHDPRFSDNPLVTGDPNIRFYAGAPLITSEGFALGSLCLIDRTPRELTDSQLALLRLLASQVAGRIELQHRIAVQEDLIANRERAESAARESERRLRLALESGRVGIWDIDLTSGTHLEISGRCKAHFGLQPYDSFDENAFFQAVHPDDLARVRKVYGEAMANRKDIEIEFRVVWPDGSIHWLRDYSTSVQDEEGRAVRLIGASQEITGEKEREEKALRELHEAQERADRDSLTGLWNHRKFHSRLEEEAARARSGGTTFAIAMLDLDNFKFFNDTHGHLIGDDVLRQVTWQLRAGCHAGDTVARFGGDEFALLLPDVGGATAGEIEARLLACMDGLSYYVQEVDCTIPLSVSVGAALYPGDGLDPLKALHQADERLLRAKTGGSDETEAEQVRLEASRRIEGFSMLDALVTAVDNKDRYTRRHSEDVMMHSVMIARELGMDESAQHTVAVAALVHDVGKIGVPDAVLRKPGKLTKEEFAAIKQHPEMGAAMVGAVPGLEDTLDAVRHHHERWDGKGYPDGLSGEETPLIARLMAVADAYSAMTTDRPYRKGMDPERAIGILRNGAGSQWDRRCVEAFLASQAKSRSVSSAPELEPACEVKRAA